MFPFECFYLWQEINIGKGWLGVWIDNMTISLHSFTHIHTSTNNVIINRNNSDCKVHRGRAIIQLNFSLLCASIHPITQATLTSLRKPSSLSRSPSRRMSERRLSSEAHLRFCRTVRVRFPVSWQNLSRWDLLAQTWDRPAGGVARGLGGLNQSKWVRLIASIK